MKVLAIDAAGKGLSVAIAEEGRLIASAEVNVGLTHSQRLLPVLDAVMQAAAMKMDDVDMVAVVNGPGSFTGLRIGVATAKGLAEGAGKPLVTVPTMAAEAYAVRGMGAYIVPMSDARRNEVYTALFSEAGEELMEVAALSPEKLCEQLAAFAKERAGARFILVGDAAAIYFEKIRDILAAAGIEVLLAPPERRLFGAVGCAFIGLERAEQAAAPELAQAFYLRQSEAERNRLAKLQQEQTENSGEL